MSPSPATRWNLTPARIAGIYLLFGVTALLVSDVLLDVLFADPLLATLQGIKGVLEVLATAGLIYLLVTWSQRDLRLQQRATDAAPIGVTLTDPDQDDNPIVLANDRFEELTGYTEAEVLGRNCRLLQGPDTSPRARAELRRAIDQGRPASVDIENYRKNGQKFWNKVAVAPVRNANGEITNYVGFQTDITERKIREQRLEVLNRVLRHNIRNKMTVIAGHAELLADERGQHPALETIQRSVADLESLIETVRTSEDILEAAAKNDEPIDLTEDLRILVDGISERYPRATIDLSLPTDSLRVPGTGILRAIEEGLDNAVRHNHRAEPSVAVTVERDGENWALVDIVDDGPGIPPSELEVLAEGETPLKHGNRLGIWSIHWIVTLAGGSIDIEDAGDGGTRVSIRIPTVAA
jgi:PAS domain S-box-containing protein